MTVSFLTVFNTFSNLSVTGLAIFDIDEIPEAVDNRKPALIPHPDMIENPVIERDSMGAASAMMTMSYTLKMRLCYAPAGSGRGLQYLSKVIEMIGLIIDATVAIGTFTGATTFDWNNLDFLGNVTDPAGNVFYGADISFAVTEFIN